MRRKLIVYILLLAGLISCREPYEPEIVSLDFGFLVVEGNIEVGGNEISQIQLKRTRGIYDSITATPVTQAQVWAESASGTKFFFTYGMEGTYLNEENLPFGQNYRLHIKLENGRGYSSEWLTPQRTPDIYDVYFEKEDDGVFIYLDSSDGNEAGFLFWSFEEVWQFRTPFHSFYRYEPSINDMVVRDESINICFMENKPGRILLADTEQLEEGKVTRQEITRIPNESEKLGIRYSIEVVQRAIDSEAFEFWDIMRKNTEDVGDIFSPMPSIIPSNIANNENPEEPVIGFVGIGSTERKRIYINSFDVLPWRARIDEYINCEVADTIRQPDFPTYFSTGRFLPLYGLPEPDSDGYILYLTTTLFCADCRFRGTLEQPKFWEAR